MSINQLIAQGVAPIGRDLPQIGNLLAQRRDQEQRNELARMAAQTDQQNAESYRAQLDAATGQREQAATAAQREQSMQWATNAVNTVRQNPQMIPALVREGKMRGIISADTPDTLTLDQVEEFALRNGIAAPKAQVPFEQTADFQKIQAQNAAAFQLERQRAASAERLERLRQSGNRGPADKRDPPPTAAELEARRDAKQKLVTVDAAMRRVERLAAASQNLGNAVADGGPVDGFLLSRTPSGQELVQSAASLMPALTALTRVPGIGAQSDLEQRLAQLQLPDPSMYPDVRARAVDELKLFMADLRNAYLNAAGMEGGTSAAPSQAAPAQSGGWSIQEIR